MKNKEKRILLSLLKAYEREKEPFYIRTPFMVTGWLVLVFVLVVVKRLLEANNLNIFLAMLAMIFAGLAIGLVLVAKESYKCRPYIKPYLDLESIRRQIAERDENA